MREALSESSLIDRNNSALQKIQPDTVTWIVRQIIRTRSGIQAFAHFSDPITASSGDFGIYRLQATIVHVGFVDQCQ